MKRKKKAIPNTTCKIAVKNWWHTLLKVPKSLLSIIYKKKNLPVLETRLNIEALGWKVHGRLEELKPWEKVFHYHDLTENLWRIVQYYQSNNHFHNHHHDPLELHWHSKSSCNTLNFQPIHTNAPILLGQQFHDIHLDTFQHKTFHSWYFRELLMQMLT